MFEAVPIDKVKIKPNRQRRDLGSLEELKASILQLGLINSIVVEEAEYTDDGIPQWYLIAGERRFTAWSQLYAEGKVPSAIPAKLLKYLDEPTRQLIELEENIKRKDLTWQEQVKATGKLFKLKGFENYQEAGAYFGVSPSTMSYTMQLYANLENPKVAQAPTIQTAHSVVKRENARAIDNLSMEITSFFKAEVQQEKESKNDKAKQEATGSIGQISQSDGADSEQGQPELSVEVQSPYQIKQADFMDFAKKFEGKPFDLIHLDFPYGINHDRSQQGNTASFGTYEDSEDIYKTLVMAFLQNQDHLVAEKAHCICWLSLRFEKWTKEAFAKAGWSCHMQPLIWHKSDNRGIIADVQCGFRNVCEYALFFNKGRKAVVKNISNLFSSPTTKRFHASEKPLPMLKYFFSGLCDHYSRVLDPTCGSGTAIMAAEFYGAEEALGLELDPDFALKAQEYLSLERFNNTGSTASLADELANLDLGDLL